MRDEVNIIIALLASGFSIEEAKESMGLNNQQLNNLLKTVRDLGYNYQKTFYDDGEIIIKASRRISLNPRDRVKVNVRESTFHTLFISDAHVGGPYEKPKRLKVVSDYAKSHDIHTIFNAGDLINNYYPGQEPDIKYTSYVDQAKRYLRYVPFEDRLTYFNLGGNHDYKSLIEHGFDPLRYFEDRRYNQISMGYGLCFIQLKDDTIAIAHDLKNANNNINSTLVFRGHSHKFRNRDAKIISVPAITDNYQGPYEFIPLPGFLDLEFNFFANKITKVNLRELAFVKEELCLASEETMVIRPDYEERYQQKLQRKKK